MPGFQSLLILLIAWGALAFGGVYAWGYWSIAAAAAALGVWALTVTGGWRRREGRVAMACLGAVAGAMVIQSVPLPLSLFARLSPSGDNVLANADLRYALQPPATHALSLVPDSTLTVLAVFAALALLFVGLMYVTARLKLEGLVFRIMVLGVLLAVFAVAQKAANIRSLDNDSWQLVYGFWKPIQAGNVFGPFINRNHFAGWTLMALSLTLGYACAVIEVSGPSRQTWRAWSRWIMTPQASKFMTVAVAVAAMGAALTVSGSRSGIASFTIAVAVMMYFVAVRIGRRRLRLVAVGYLGLLVAGAVLWAGLGSTIQRFALASTDMPSRFSAWHDALRIIRDFPLFGTGVGGFGQAMLVYQSGDRETFYAQAHNDYLQIAADGGLLVAIPVVICLVALGRGIRKRLVRGEDNATVFWIRAGAISGLVGIAAQSLVEFSLQMAGNFVLFVVLAAIAVHRPLPPGVHARRL